MSTRPRDRYGRPLPRGAQDELVLRQEPDEVVGSVHEAFAEAVKLFDRQRFFEAHEFFEYIWKSDEVADDDRDFWKGLTQVAVGCCHTQRGNERGAVTLLERASNYLESYPDAYQGVAVATLRALARHVADTVRERGASPEVRFPLFPREPEAREGRRQDIIRESDVRT